ncbi:MAG: SpoVA/SpoVAEb family sporulation membrane protein [bacterium]|nr:SpoVA/SpoVAEb family sporulation membrane protein [bacterium]
MEIDKKQYDAYVQQITPKHSLAQNMWRAFVTGGGICLLGQLLNRGFLWLGADEKSASAGVLLSLIALSVLLTGFGIFHKIVEFGGAGALVPITGFANAVAAPAIEYKKEGQVFGIGCKIFTIAGPVILYGIVASWILGMIFFVGQLVGIW